MSNRDFKTIFYASLFLSIAVLLVWQNQSRPPIDLMPIIRSTPTELRSSENPQLPSKKTATRANGSIGNVALMPQNKKIVLPDAKTSNLQIIPNILNALIAPQDQSTQSSVKTASPPGQGLRASDGGGDCYGDPNPTNTASGNNTWAACCNTDCCGCDDYECSLNPDQCYSCQQKANGGNYIWDSASGDCGID